MEKQRPKYQKKVWGKEEHIINNEKYCRKKLHLKKGFRCSIHAHPKEETFYVERGLVFMELENNSKKASSLSDDNENFSNSQTFALRGKASSNEVQMENSILKTKDIVHIFPNKYHRFSGLKNSVIIEFSTPDTESSRKNSSEAIPDFEKWREEVMGEKNE